MLPTVAPVRYWIQVCGNDFYMVCSASHCTECWEPNIENLRLEEHKTSTHGYNMKSS